MFTSVCPNIIFSTEIANYPLLSYSFLSSWGVLKGQSLGVRQGNLLSLTLPRYPRPTWHLAHATSLRLRYRGRQASASSCSDCTTWRACAWFSRFAERCEQAHCWQGEYPTFTAFLSMSARFFFPLLSPSPLSCRPSRSLSLDGR